MALRDDDVGICIQYAYLEGLRCRRRGAVVVPVQASTSQHRGTVATSQAYQRQGQEYHQETIVAWATVTKYSYIVSGHGLEK